MGGSGGFWMMIGLGSGSGVYNADFSTRLFQILPKNVVISASVAVLGRR